MAELVEQLNEARKVVEELGGKKTKSLDELKGELDRMIEASKKPGYSPDDAAILIQKRALVLDAMGTALDVLVDDTLDTTAAESEKTTEAPTEPRIVPEATTSVFVSTSEKSEPTKTPVPVTGTRLERFMSGARSMASSGYENVSKFFSWAGKGISDFLTYAGTSISALWNRLFVKKDNNVPVEETVKPTEPTPEVPDDATRRYEENPPPSEVPTSTAPTDAIPSGTEGGIVTADTEPTVSSPAPLTEAEATPSPEVAAVNIMDGKEHAIAGHNIVWTGNADNLLSIDGKIFGVTLLTIGKIMAGSPTLEKRGDTLVIRAAGRTFELTKAQASSLFSQALNGTRTTNFFPHYDYVSVNLEYSTVKDDGASATRSPGSMVIELLPK